MKFTKHHNFQNILKTSNLFTEWLLQDDTFKFQEMFEIWCIHYLPNSVKSAIFTIILCVVLYRGAHCLSWLDKHSKHRSCTFFAMQYFKSPKCTVTTRMITTKHTTHIFTLISCWTNLSYYLALSIKSVLISPIVIVTYDKLTVLVTFSGQISCTMCCKHFYIQCPSEKVSIM